MKSRNRKDRFFKCYPEFLEAREVLKGHSFLASFARLTQAAAAQHAATPSDDTGSAAAARATATARATSASGSGRFFSAFRFGRFR